MKFNPKQVEEAIKGSGGVKLVICNRLGLSRPTFDKWLFWHPEIKEWLESEKQDMVDQAITNLHELVKIRDWDATKHVLNSLGKSQGFSDKQPIQLIGKQQNVSVNTEPTYKFVIEKSDDVRNTLEAEPETETGV